MRRIHLLRPGTHKGVTFSEADIRALAERYDPASHEAPIVVGHPKSDAPAYGWIGRLEADADGLHAVPRDVDPEFEGMVAARRFAKVSCAIYRPATPGNPTPGHHHLRHVAFLGAQPPAVKGLKAVELADDGEGALVLEEPWPAWGALGRLLRRVREWVISEHDLETADSVLPSWEIDQVAAEGEPPAAAELSEAEEDGMPTDEKARREAELARREADIKAREEALAEREAKAARDAAVRESLAFAERLAAEGRVAPADRDGLAALHLALPGDDEPLELAEGRTQPAKAWLEEWGARLPVQIEYAEVAPGEGDGQPPAPDGEGGDRERLHREALEYSEEHGVSYEGAVLRIDARRAA